MPVVKQLILGLTAIGLVTTAVMSGRQTDKVITASGNAVSKLYGTVISGKTS